MERLVRLHGGMWVRRASASRNAVSVSEMLSLRTASIALWISSSSFRASSCVSEIDAVVAARKGVKTVSQTVVLSRGDTMLCCLVRVIQVRLQADQDRREDREEAKDEKG